METLNCGIITFEKKSLNSGIKDMFSFVEDFDRIIHFIDIS